MELKKPDISNLKMIPKKKLFFLGASFLAGLGGLLTLVILMSSTKTPSVQKLEIGEIIGQEAVQREVDLLDIEKYGVFPVVKKKQAYKWVEGSWQLKPDFLSMLDKEYVAGITLHFPWSEIERQPETYSWGLLMGIAAAVSDKGKLVNISLTSANNSPDWIYNQGVKAYTYTNSKGSRVKAPVPWDAKYLELYFRFVRKFGEKLEQSSDFFSRVKRVSIGGPTNTLGLETTIIGNEQDQEFYLQAGYPDQFVSAWKQAIDVYTQAIPEQIELDLAWARGLQGHESNQPAKTIVDYIFDQGLADRVNLKSLELRGLDWWNFSDAASGYPPKQKETLLMMADEQSRGFEIGLQFAVSDVLNQNQSKYGAFEAAVNNALSMNPVWIEPWAEDILDQSEGTVTFAKREELFSQANSRLKYFEPNVPTEDQAHKGIFILVQNNQFFEKDASGQWQWRGEEATKPLLDLLDLPYVSGFTYWVSWSSFEPVEGQYQWILVDKLIEEAAQKGKKINVSLTTGWSPEWLLNDPKVEKLTFTKIPMGGGTPTETTRQFPLDPIYLDKYFRAITALAGHLKDSPTIHYIGIGGPSSTTGLETHIAADEDDLDYVKQRVRELTGASTFEQGYSQAWIKAIDHFASLFPDKHLALALSGGLEKDRTPKSAEMIYDYLQSSGYKGTYGIPVHLMTFNITGKDWWSPDKYGYMPQPILDLISKASVDGFTIGWQFLGIAWGSADKEDRARPFGPAFEKGVLAGAGWMEVWPEDIMKDRAFMPRDWVSDTHPCLSGLCPGSYEKVIEEPVKRAAYQMLFCSVWDNKQGTCTVPTVAPTSSPTPLPLPSLTSTPTPTFTPSPSPSLSPTPTLTLTLSPSPTPTPTPTPMPVSSGLEQEAEEGILTGEMKAGSDPLASNGRYIYPTGAGKAVYWFTVNQESDYYLWLRVNTHDSGSNSFYADFDNGVRQTLSLPKTKDQWRWTKAKFKSIFFLKTDKFPLGAGVHALTISRRENDTKLDRFILTSDPGFTP